LRGQHEEFIFDYGDLRVRHPCGRAGRPEFFKPAAVPQALGDDYGARAPMSRSIIIGDIHGCAAELDALLDRIALTSDDRVYCVGDLVARGPDGIGVLGILREAGARSALGNHDAKLRDLRPRPGAKPPSKVPNALAAVFHQLTEADWDLFDALPLWIDLPEHELRVVHAGVVPNVPIEKQDPWVLTNLRSFDAEGEPSSKWSEVTWAESYRERPHIAFGHDARSRLQLKPCATGLDTGCVYGAELSALVLPAGSEPPPPAERRDALVSVPARQAYADLGAGG
jgi:hypothetical protein